MRDELGVPLPISGATRLYAIVGDPIAQVGSPGLFNREFARLRSQSVLVPLCMPSGDLATAMQTFRAARNFDGLVVTVPHKIPIAGLVDEIGDMARRVGSVNAIRKLPDGRLFGDNFDGIGFVQGLRTRGHAIRGKRVLVLGAGGAGCSVAHAILDEVPEAIGLHDRDPARVAAVVSSLRGQESATTVGVSLPDPSDYDVVVNCTPLGMKRDDPFPAAVERLRSGTLVADIVLDPKGTRFLDEAVSRGCPVQPGIHMLEGQVSEICRFFEVGERA